LLSKFFEKVKKEKCYSKFNVKGIIKSLRAIPTDIKAKVCKLFFSR